MSEFKIALGFDVKDDSREKIQRLIDSINAEKPEIKVDINTTDALKKVKELQKELKKLKDINIKINTKFNQSNNGNTKNNKNNTNTQLSTNVNKVSWKKVDKNSNSNSDVNFDSSDFEKATDRAKETYDAYSKLLNIAKELKKHRITLEGLNVAKDSRQIDVVESEITRLLISYTELKNAFKDDLSISQLNNIDKIFEETRFSVNKLKASMEDTSEFKEILFQFNMLKEKAREIGSANTKLVNLDVSKNASEINFLTQRVNELNNEYYELLNTLSHKLSAEQLIELSNIFYKSEISVEHLNSKLADTKNKIGSAIGEKVDTKYKIELDNIATSMTRLSDVSTILKSDFANLQTIWQDMGTAKASGNIEKLIDLNNEYSKVLNKVKTELKESQNSQKIYSDSINLESKKQKLSDDIDIWLKKNSAGAKEFGGTLKNIQSEIKTADSLKLKNLTNQFKEVDRQAELAGKKGLSFVDSIKQQFERMTSYFTLYDVYSYTKRTLTSMFNEVKNVDTAMSGLYRVTDLTSSQYDEMYNGMTDSAKKYGLVLSELIDGTTTWAKLGFDGQQASQLGEISARYQVVADTDAETAVTNLVTAYKGFQDELLNLYNGDSAKAVEYVSDIFNKLGNEYAIDAEKIGIALTKSASALNVAGNSIQESAGMITGITEVTGNAERAGKLMPEHIVIYGTTYVVWHYGKSVKS